MIQGCYVALVTPFRDGKLDRAALEKLAERLVTAGVDGLVPCGTTGESPALSEEEYDLVVSTAVKAARGKCRVVAGSGTNCTAKTVALSQRAVELGVDGVMLVSPYYNKPTQDGLFAHFAAVAQAVDKPIMLYNIPGRTGVTIQVDTIARLRQEYRHIQAVKHATGEVIGVSELRTRSDIAIMSGDDPLTLPMMSMGAVGVVSVLGNLIPEDLCKLTRAALAGNWSEALRWHERTFKLGQALLSICTNPIPIKTALALRGDMAEEFRLPMCPMNAAQKTALQTAIRQYQESAEA